MSRLRWSLDECFCKSAVYLLDIVSVLPVTAENFAAAYGFILLLIGSRKVDPTEYLRKEHGVPAPTSMAGGMVLTAQVGEEERSRKTGTGVFCGMVTQETNCCDLESPCLD